MEPCERLFHNLHKCIYLDLMLELPLALQSVNISLEPFKYVAKSKPKLGMSNLSDMALCRSDL